MKLYLNARDDQITFNKKHYLLRAAKRMGLEDVVLDAAIHPEDKMESVLNIEPFVDFKKGTNWTGIWEIDVQFDRPQMSMSNWVHCNAVFIANNNLPKRMNFNGPVITLFQACDPVLHRRLEVEPEFDFISCGSAGMDYIDKDGNVHDIYEGRTKAISILRSAGYSFGDLGKGHEPEEYVKRLNKARVQFVRSGAHEPWGSQVEQRFFECLAIGPLLKDWHSDLAHTGLIEGVDYFSYKDDEEMVAKMSILINNPEFAKKMAISGRRKAVAYHSYESRLGAILAHIALK